MTIIFVGVYMVTTKREFAHYDAFIYVFTTTAGIILSYLLYVSRLVPRLLSKLGLFGYVVLAIGIPITLMGLAELDRGWGLIFVAPGGLFELILPLLLLFKGFSIDRNEPRQPKLGSTIPATSEVFWRAEAENTNAI